MDVEKNRTPCIAVRLHPLVQMIKSAGIHADQKRIRQEFNECYGHPYTGNQHFLHPDHSSPKPIRCKSYRNTTHAKCIFIPRSDVGQDIEEILLAAAG